MSQKFDFPQEFSSLGKAYKGIILVASPQRECCELFTENNCSFNRRAGSTRRRLLKMSQMPFFVALRMRITRMLTTASAAAVEFWWK